MSTACPWLEPTSMLAMSTTIHGCSMESVDLMLGPALNVETDTI